MWEKTGIRELSVDAQPVRILASIIRAAMGAPIATLSARHLQDFFRFQEVKGRGWENKPVHLNDVVFHWWSQGGRPTYREIVYKNGAVNL